MSRAAHLKKPRRGFFPAGLFGGSMLFESTRLASGKVITKQKLQYPVRILEFLVGAGGCREPRSKGARVAAPSGCIVPWAARASCWPQPQQLLPVSAAGSGRRCCTGAFFPAGLFGGSMLFSSTLVVRYKVQIKQKLQRHNNVGVLGGAKQPKSEPLPSEASLAAISLKEMVFVPSL